MLIYLYKSIRLNLVFLRFWPAPSVAKMILTAGCMSIAVVYFFERNRMSGLSDFFDYQMMIPLYVYRAEEGILIPSWR